MFIIVQKESKDAINVDQIDRIYIYEGSSLRVGGTLDYQIYSGDDLDNRFDDVSEAAIAKADKYDCNKPIGSWKKPAGRPRKENAPKKEA